MGDPSNQAKDIFLAAIEEHTSEQWPAFLERACAGDTRLRAEVERLLQARLQMGSFHEAAPPNLLATVDEPITERLGTTIGPYKLLEQIGEGGFGIVFMAEQTQPIRRKVALKVLKPGMDTRQVVARFEAERQALALMDHPNIAHVFDGGETATGRPYFVMELVRGIPITDFCDQSRLSIRERLELFVNVCQAVQHAHQKGIIHRDIKPSNVLVTMYDGSPMVKVIDFGIAKATGKQLTDKTLFTHFAQMVGTPLYMSPEQAGMSGQDADTRSDIYSLGVLLYELLTGTTPFDRERLRQAGYDELRRIIREEEPAKPSTRISTLGQAATIISTQRQSDVKRISQLLRGELDWIVMKALEKDRNRRYETASAFVADVQRYLHDEPVQACPPSPRYRLGKFLRRYKGRVTAAALMLVLLLAGTAVSTWQAVRATRAEQQTETALAQVTEAQAQTREALDTLTDDVVETFFARQPEIGEMEKAFLRKVLGFYEAFTQQSGETVEARLLQAKGYFKAAHLRNLLGELQPAVEDYRKAEVLLEKLAGEFPDQAEYRHHLSRTEGNLGILLAEIGKPGEAETALRYALKLRTELAEQFSKSLEFRHDLASIYHDLGSLLDSQERYADAVKLYYQALDLEEKLVEQSRGAALYRQSLARSRSSIGGLLRKQKRCAEAAEQLDQAVKIQEKLLPDYPSPRSRRQLADSYEQLGIVLTELNRGADAERVFRKGLDLRTKLRDEFPKVHQYGRALARHYHDLAYFLWRQQRYADAEEAYHQALERTEKLVAEHEAVPTYRQDLAKVYFGLGHLLRDQKKYPEAEKSYQQALSYQTKLVNDSPKLPGYRNELVDTLVTLALLHGQRRDFVAAIPLLEQARSHLQAALEVNPENPTSRRFYRDNLRLLARCYLDQADHPRLIPLAEELARFGYDPPHDIYSAASLLCRCMSLAVKDGRFADAKRRELIQSYADRALILLRQAVDRGFKDAAHMRKDTDLNPLRTRKEFQKLLAEVEAKTKG